MVMPYIIVQLRARDPSYLRELIVSVVSVTCAAQDYLLIQIADQPITFAYMQINSWLCSYITYT